MSWSTNTRPKQQGWYLVTTKKQVVMPAYRMEYPSGNFFWRDFSGEVYAVMKFPKPYKENKYGMD